MLGVCEGRSDAVLVHQLREVLQHSAVGVGRQGTQAAGTQSRCPDGMFAELRQRYLCEDILD